jgi:hypothetical protein
MEFNKSERRVLRDLAAEVYEAEAHAVLEKLAIEFDRWRDGTKLSSELLAAIHEFHQHQSRELWSMYQGIPAALAVERGLSLGLIASSRIPAQILAKLRVSRLPISPE